MPPSVGGVKEVTDYFSLFDYDINLLDWRTEEGRRPGALRTTWTLQCWLFWRRPSSPVSF